MTLTFNALTFVSSTSLAYPIHFFFFFITSVLEL